MSLEYAQNSVIAKFFYRVGEGAGQGHTLIYINRLDYKKSCLQSMPAIELMLPGFVYTSTVHCLHSCILVVVYLYYGYYYNNVVPIQQRSDTDLLCRLSPAQFSRCIVRRGAALPLFI